MFTNIFKHFTPFKIWLATCFLIVVFSNWLVDPWLDPLVERLYGKTDAKYHANREAKCKAYGAFVESPYKYSKDFGCHVKFNGGWQKRKPQNNP